MIDDHKQHNIYPRGVIQLMGCFFSAAKCPGICFLGGKKTLDETITHRGLVSLLKKVNQHIRNLDTIGMISSQACFNGK